jgi:proline dehydrogenase
MPLAARAARTYVAGDRLDDALTVAERLTARGFGVTLGYWDGCDESPRAVNGAYLEAIAALAGREHAYLSIKVPSLKFSRELIAELVEHAAAAGVRLHFDALGPETAEKSRALCDEFIDGPAELSYTLPGRWARSIGDAAWAAERGIAVRVVKGQWPDPADPKRDLRASYLEVVDALAGRARYVAVATHDVPLATQAIKRLLDARTPCGMELLYGLPMRGPLAVADRLAVGVHVYVPYGKAYLPYAISRAGMNPRIAWWLVRDLLLGRSSRQTGSTPKPETPAPRTEPSGRADR